MSHQEDDTTPDLLMERLEEALSRCEGLCRLIQKRCDEPQKVQWENLNTILYAAHSAVTAERSGRRSTDQKE